MVNTKDAKDKRAQEYLENGFELVRPGVQLEPYITWDQMVLSMLNSQVISNAIENSLQLSETDRIFNSRKEKK